MSALTQDSGVMTDPNGIKHERDLVRIGAKPVDAYAAIALTSLTAYSLYWINKWQLRRTIEAIAILNWRLFPDKFAMVGFREYPDAFRTNRSILQMQPKYRNLLTGAAITGFSLNDRGVEVAQDLIRQIGVPTTDDGAALGAEETPPQRKTTNRPARSIEPEREMKKLRSSRLYEKWTAGTMSERDLIHVHTALGIFDHTPVSVRRRAVKELTKSAMSMSDNDVLRFLDDVRKTFPQARLG